MQTMLKNIDAGECWLEEITTKHFEQVIQWRNDINNNKYLNQPFVSTMETQNRWYENYTKDKNQIVYMMISPEGNAFGMIGLKQIDLQQKQAEVGNFLVIEKYRGNLAMAECLISFYEEAFKLLELLYGSMVENNKRIVKLNTQLGFFKPEFQLPKQECQQYRNDLIDTCITRDSFRNSKLYKSIMDRRLNS